jgi:DNA cross-link repair 1B protein
MILFEGYFGRVLHTGDIRFNRQVFEQYDLLYPSNVRNAEFEACAKHVDVLHLDNTFCDPVFEFPSAESALKDLMSFVGKIGKRKLYVGLDNIGKEEILVELAKHFETCVVVDGTRYKNILLMGHDPNIFTTDLAEGWIEVVPKRALRRRLI